MTIGMKWWAPLTKVLPSAGISARGRPESPSFCASRWEM